MQPAPQKFAKMTPESPGTCIVCGGEMTENTCTFSDTCLKCEVLTDVDDVVGKPRARSMAESGRSAKSESKVKVPPMIPRYSQQKVLSLDDFTITQNEENAMKSIATDELTYALQRTVHASELSDEEKQQMPLPDLRCKLYLEHKDDKVEKSKYSYAPLLDKHADDIDTIDECLDIIHGHASKFQSPTEPLVVAGDAKTFDHLQELKRTNGEQLDWVIPFVGDFHILMNIQPVLMKIFWDAGLKDTSKQNFKTDFYQKHLKDCSKFKTDHEFFLQVWEALYQYQIETFMKWRADNFLPTGSDISNSVKECLEALKIEKTSGFTDVSEFLTKQKNLEEQIEDFESEFTEFRNIMNQKDKTFKFWDGFVHKQVFAYIGLWIAVRSGNWDLRLGCLKSLAPLFHAFDRQNYAKIVVQHLADVARMPPLILEFMRNGGFTISLSGTPYASVALDEAHEMTINKDMKSVITDTHEDYIVAKSEYLPFRALLQKALDRLVMTTRKTVPQKNLSKSIIATVEMNVKQYKQKISQSKAFEVPIPDCEKLVQLYTNVEANKQQDNDLLSFESIGQEHLENYINLFILKRPTDKLVVKRKNLKTFSKKAESKQKQKQESQAMKDKYFALKAQAAESTARNLPISKVGQLIELPRAIAQENKLPVKGQKSSATKFLAKRYKDKKVVIEGNIPPVSPDVVILEGMFMINTKPRKTCRTFGAYAEVLLKRWIIKWLSKGTSQIHIVFDDPDRNQLNPKEIERSRRYGQGTSDKSKDIDVITADTKIPRGQWTDFLSNRQNKRKLCDFLSHQWCKVISDLRLLKPIQKFITSGGFMDPDRRDLATCITLDGIDQKLFSGTHIEGDTRCWLHAYESQGKIVQIYSPDTDVYHIGLNLLDRLTCTQTVVVQINMPGSQLQKYISVNKLAEELVLDQELNAALNSLAPKYLHIVYVCSGCDYVSYFTKLGKPTFYRLAFKYADFIWNGKINHNESVPGNFESMPEAGCQECSGMPTDICPSCRAKITDSACAFFRLIGVVYYTKYANAFSTYDSPCHHFSEITGQSLQTDVTPYQLHCKWLDDIRERIWQRFVFEDEVFLLKYGWQADKDTGVLCIEWDLPENMAKVRQYVKVLTTFCNCKTSGCAKDKPNKHCKCFKLSEKGGCSKLCGCGGKCSFPEVVNEVPTTTVGSSHSATTESRAPNQVASHSATRELCVPNRDENEIMYNDSGSDSEKDSESDSGSDWSDEEYTDDFDIQGSDLHYNMPLDDDIDEIYADASDDEYSADYVHYQWNQHQAIHNMESDYDISDENMY
jgi:hypothetical protein